MHINVFQVVYFTATFPYVILIALLVRGVTLPGAKVGLEYLFIPDWSKLGEFQVWRNAAEQMFFSLGISWGGLMMFGNFLDKINLRFFLLHFDKIISTFILFRCINLWPKTKYEKRSFFVLIFVIVAIQKEAKFLFSNKNQIYLIFGICFLDTG